ncbi:cytochrome P450 [Amylostereum chailletii]|nr:cytochrome P450 [Amylostereum chailletii]
MEQSWTSLILSLLLILAAYKVWRNYQQNAPISRLPPGPPPNALTNSKLCVSSLSGLVGTSHPTLPIGTSHFLQFAQWCKEYGPIYTFRSGRHIRVVLGTYKAAVDVLEKEGAATADRPVPPAGDMISHGMRFLLCPAGERHRLLRKAMHMHFQAKAAQSYRRVQLVNAKQLVLDILDDPDAHVEHAKRYSASVILSITYGRPSPGKKYDPDIAEAEEGLMRFSQCLHPGAYLVNEHPWLRHVLFYGRDLRKQSRAELAFFRRLMEGVRADMAGDVDAAAPSLTKYLLENRLGGETGLTDDELAYFSGSMFAAGIDTTAAGISYAIMAAACHPDAQAQVQSELDSVVGGERCPTFSDFDALPLLRAFVLETLRWRPISAAGIQHRATQDIVYGEYVIPKGAVVVANHWAISRDPALFDDADAFNLARWFDTDREDADVGGHVRLRHDLIFPGFGFGRRVCPGQDLALSSLTLNIASLLHTFEISQDPARPIDSMDLRESLNVQPRPFVARFRVRGLGGEKALRETMRDVWMHDG